jgi:hypothetical protein
VCVHAAGRRRALRALVRGRAWGLAHRLGAAALAPAAVAVVFFPLSLLVSLASFSVGR